MHAKEEKSPPAAGCPARTRLRLTSLSLIALALVTRPAAGLAQEYAAGPLRSVAHFQIQQIGSPKPIRSDQVQSQGGVYFSNLATPTGSVVTQGPASTVSGNGITRLIADDINGVPPTGDVINITFSVANQNCLRSFPS